MCQFLEKGARGTIVFQIFRDNQSAKPKYHKGGTHRFVSAFSAEVEYSVPVFWDALLDRPARKQYDENKVE